MRYYFVHFFILFSSFSYSQGKSIKNQENQIRAVIEQLFDGMRESDTSKVSACFHADAKLSSTYFNEKMDRAKVRQGEKTVFLEAIATPKKEIWNEQISNLEINIDDYFATAWMDYSFYIDETLSHCGVNSIQFLQNDGKWQIIGIIDTRRTENCEK